jgi:hypothetical protein
MPKARGRKTARVEQLRAQLPPRPVLLVRAGSLD